MTLPGALRIGLHATFKNVSKDLGTHRQVECPQLPVACSRRCFCLREFPYCIGIVVLRYTESQTAIEATGRMNKEEHMSQRAP